MEKIFVRFMPALAVCSCCLAIGPAAQGNPCLSALDEASESMVVVRPFSRELVVVSCDEREVKARVELPFDAAALAVDDAAGRVLVAGPDAVRLYALEGLDLAGELPLAGIRFLATLPGGGIAALAADGTLTVARVEPFAVSRTVKLDPGETVRRLNARLDPDCRYEARAMRFDAARNLLHIILGPPDGAIMYSRKHKPVDAWLAVDPAAGVAVANTPVLAPCCDLAIDAAEGMVYGLSRAYNADHILVLDAGANGVRGVIPLERMEVHNVDRLALAPSPMLAVGSSMRPKDLFFIIREDAPAWWGGHALSDEAFLKQSAPDIERTFAETGFGRGRVVAYTASLWGLRGAWDAMHFSKSDNTLYLPGECGVLTIDADTIAGMRPATRPTQAFFQREGESLADALRRAPQSEQAMRSEHNTLAPAVALSLEELRTEGDVFRVERYILPGPMGIFPMELEPFSIRKDRPRVFLTPETLPGVREKCEGPLQKEFEAYKSEIYSYVDRITRPQQPAISWVHGAGIMAGAAFCWLVTGEDDFLGMVRGGLGWMVANPDHWKPTGGQDEDYLTPVAAAYDWCHAGFTPEERERFGRYIYEKLKTPEIKTWHKDGNWAMQMTHNSEIGRPMKEIASAVILHDEPWLDPAEAEAMVRRGVNGLRGVFGANQEVGWDGGNPEAGYSYSIRDLEIPLAVAAMWQSATGQNLLDQAGFIGHADAWILYGVRPDLRFTKMGDGGPGPYPFGKDGKFYTGNTPSNKIMAGMKQSPYFHWVARAIGPDRWRGYQYFIYLNPDVTPAPTHLDPDVEPRLDVNEPLPLARMFRGVGYLFSKSGWDPDALHLYFCGREWRAEHHQTMENNAFQVFKGGPLLIDAGQRWGMTRGYAYNYLRSTLSKNTILVHDPRERAGAVILGPTGGSSFNVGGQIDFLTDWNKYKTIKLLDRGGFTAYENRLEFMYSSADATPAYSYHKLRQFNRQIVHIRPDTVVIFDRVIAKDPEFRKTFLLHSFYEPEMRGTEFSVYADRGLLKGKTLLPEQASMTIVGGPGKEFWVGEEALYLDYPDSKDGRVPTGRNPNFSPIPEAFMDVGTDGYYKRPPESYSAPVPEALGVRVGEHKPAQEPKTAEKSPLDEIVRRAYPTWSVKTADEWLQKFIVEYEAGAWRIEVSPSEPRARDFFLHVLHAAIPPEAPANADEAFDARAGLFPQSELVREGDMLGARITLPDGRRVEVLFETVGRPGGFIRITGPDGSVSLDRRLAESVDRTPRR